MIHLLNVLFVSSVQNTQKQMVWTTHSSVYQRISLDDELLYIVQTSSHNVEKWIQIYHNTVLPVNSNVDLKSLQSQPKQTIYSQCSELDFRVFSDGFLRQNSIPYTYSQTCLKGHLYITNPCLQWAVSIGPLMNSGYNFNLYIKDNC